MSEPQATPPVVEVVAGSPTEEELAAVVAVLAAATQQQVSEQRGRRTDLPAQGGWKSYWRTVRRKHRPGPDAWAHPLR